MGKRKGQGVGQAPNFSDLSSIAVLERRRREGSKTPIKDSSRGGRTGSKGDLPVLRKSGPLTEG